MILGTSPASNDDGLLQVREIQDLPLRADLVVLSACETGSGKLLGEEGIASLERAFLLAGAKSVVASLWTADDIFTNALMKWFYEHLASGVGHRLRPPPGQAFSSAALSLMGTDPGVGSAEQRRLLDKCLKTELRFRGIDCEIVTQLIGDISQNYLLRWSAALENQVHLHLNGLPEPSLHTFWTPA